MVFLFDPRMSMTQLPNQLLLECYITFVLYVVLATLMPCSPLTSRHIRQCQFEAIKYWPDSLSFIYSPSNWSGDYRGQPLSGGEVLPFLHCIRCWRFQSYHHILLESQWSSAGWVFRQHSLFPFSLSVPCWSIHLPNQPHLPFPQGHHHCH